jgi:hypothetical protein
MSAPEIFHSYILPLEMVIRGTHDEDLEELEWCGPFTHHRGLIREVYERQERGEVHWRRLRPAIARRVGAPRTRDEMVRLR